MQSNKISSIARRGISLTCECEDVTIKNNVFENNVPGIKPSNMLYTNIRATHENNFMFNPIRNLNIIDNRFSGLSGVAYSKGVLNGASADLITVRNVHGFIIKGNRIENSGEAGVTISDGSRNGSIVENVIVRTDTVPIVIGAAGKKQGGYRRVERVQIRDNYINQFAMFQSEVEKSGNSADWGLGQLHARSALRVFNARNVCIVGNTISKLELHGRVFFGVWVLNQLMPETHRNSRIYVGNNRYSGFGNSGFKVGRAVAPNKIPERVQVDGKVQRIVTKFDTKDVSELDESVFRCIL